MLLEFLSSLFTRINNRKLYNVDPMTSSVLFMSIYKSYCIYYSDFKSTADPDSIQGRIKLITFYDHDIFFKDHC